MAFAHVALHSPRAGHDGDLFDEWELGDPMVLHASDTGTAAPLR